ncbi:MAG TPA: MMPL family transporter, partial [Cellulomonas sp.]|nr:MMPL family transporter [Cellulomonas sp.]
MSTLLYRLGKLAYRAKGRVFLVWLVILAGVGVAVALNPPQTSTEFRIEGTASQEVLDQLERELPQTSGASASITFVAPQGERVDTPERVAAITSALDEIQASDSVVSGSDGATQEVDADMAEAMAPAGDVTMGPLMDGDTPVAGVSVSSDGHVAMVTLQLADQAINLPAGATDEIVAAAQTAAASGLTVLPGSDLTQEMVAPFGPHEAVGLVIAAIVLLLTLGSLVVAGLPLLTAIVGVIVGVGGAYALSSVIPMTSVTPILALMIGLAVGIDYALFIVNRARRLVLEKGLSAHEATGRAVGTAGSAVFFAGLTVLVSLSGLSIVGIQFLTTMALVAAGTVAIAVLVALTLLPALLGLVGERLVTPKQRAKFAASAESRGDADSHGPATRWATMVAKHRKLVTVVVVAGLGLLAVPVTSMDLNLPSAGTANHDTAERQSYDATSAGFGEGFNGPLLVVATLDDAVTPASMTQVRDTLADVDHVSAVIPGATSQDGRTV